MSVAYTAIGWNRHKRLYDGAMLALMLLYMAAFILVTKLLTPGGSIISDEILIIRVLGTLSMLMLHIVLCIGPLARLNPIFLPLLYNRRHLGVATFLVGFAHAFIVIGYYHGFGALNPLVSLLISNPKYGSLPYFPFEAFGVVALCILFVMAATSHDFWLKNLSPATWKSLHMLVYVAYGLLVLHVALGVLQSEKSPLLAVAMGLGVVVVGTLHILAGQRETSRDARLARADPQDSRWLDVAAVSDIPLDRAAIVCPRGGERIAIFRHGDTLSAVENRCAHQGGPLGEGKIIDGCITCPWHGYQYLPHNGKSPPPFTEKIKTYQVRVVDGRVQVNPAAFAPGTPVEPVQLPTNSAGARA